MKYALVVQEFEVKKCLLPKEWFGGKTRFWLPSKQPRRWYLCLSLKNIKCTYSCNIWYTHIYTHIHTYTHIHIYMDVYTFMNFDKIWPVNIFSVCFIKTNNQNKQKSDLVIKAVSQYSFLRRMAIKMVKLVTARERILPMHTIQKLQLSLFGQKQAFNNFNETFSELELRAFLKAFP